MSSPSRSLVLAVAVVLVAAVGPRAGAVTPTPGATPPSPRRVLRVCADPNNLPFSNDRRQGFENRLAELVARDLGADVAYTWWAQRRGFLRNTLKAGRCDVVMGVPVRLDGVRATRPYYRSTYVFVQRRGGAAPAIRTLDDPALRRLRIGVPIVGDDGADPPPVHALAARHIIDNLVGFTVYGDYAQPNPPARLIEAVAAGDVDVAVAWGPLAGYFARRARPQLAVVPIPPAGDRGLPFTFDIAMAVRPGDRALAGELDAILARRAREIRALLASYGVPRA